MPCHRNRVVIVVLMLALCGCSRPPADGPNSANSQNLPFDRQARAAGNFARPPLIPSTTKLPEGTPILVRLQTALSSPSAHTGDSFAATVDEAVVLDGRTLVPRGATATGRVLEAKPSARSRMLSGGGREGSLRPDESAPEIGYLRIVLVSLQVGGRAVAIETSSIFAKGGWREERHPAPGAASSATSSAASAAAKKDRDRDRDVVVGIDRRLNFRLAQAVDLQ